MKVLIFKTMFWNRQQKKSAKVKIAFPIDQNSKIELNKTHFLCEAPIHHFPFAPRRPISQFADDRKQEAALS
jgi:hypothetical protein